jgi:hypothetical protein
VRPRCAHANAARDASLQGDPRRNESGGPGTTHLLAVIRRSGAQRQPEPESPAGSEAPRGPSRVGQHPGLGQSSPHRPRPPCRLVDGPASGDPRSPTTPSPTITPAPDPPPHRGDRLNAAGPFSTRGSRGRSQLAHAQPPPRRLVPSGFTRDSSLVRGLPSVPPPDPGHQGSDQSVRVADEGGHPLVKETRRLVGVGNQSLTGAPAGPPNSPSCLFSSSGTSMRAPTGLRRVASFVVRRAGRGPQHWPGAGVQPAAG